MILFATYLIGMMTSLPYCSRRRRSGKDHDMTPSKTRPPPPVAYSKTHNGDKVAGIGKKLGEMSSVHAP